MTDTLAPDCTYMMAEVFMMHDYRTGTDELLVLYGGKRDDVFPIAVGCRHHLRGTGGVTQVQLDGNGKLSHIQSLREPVIWLPVSYISPAAV